MRPVIYDNLLAKIPNKYILTITAGKRAREIFEGDEPVINVDKKTTIIRTVLFEIEVGKVGSKNVEE